MHPYFVNRYFNILVTNVFHAIVVLILPCFLESKLRYMSQTFNSMIQDNFSSLLTWLTSFGVWWYFMNSLATILDVFPK